MESAYQIRTACQEELEVLPSIERAAAQLFRQVGMPEIADGPVLSVADLEHFYSIGWIGLLLHEEAGVVGFIVMIPVGDCGFVQEVSVHPRHGGKGLGTALLAAGEEWSQQQEFPAMTLSTFKDVPWNGPFYARRGFQTLDIESLGPEFRLLREMERQAGLDTSRRVIMRKSLKTRESESRHPV